MTDTLPRWKCHKIVEAAQFTKIEVLEDSFRIHVGPIHFRVAENFFARGRAEIGDYLVRYDAGLPTEYLSWSPRAVFEAGYIELGRMLKAEQVTTVTVEEFALTLHTSGREGEDIPIGFTPVSFLEATRRWLEAAAESKWTLRDAAGLLIDMGAELRGLVAAIALHIQPVEGPAPERVVPRFAEPHPSDIGSSTAAPPDSPALRALLAGISAMEYRAAVSQGFFACMLMMGGCIPEGIAEFKKTLARAAELENYEKS